MSFKGNDFLCVTLTPLKFIGFYGTVNPTPCPTPIYVTRFPVRYTGNRALQKLLIFSWDNEPDPLSRLLYRKCTDIRGQTPYKEFLESEVKP